MGITSPDMLTTFVEDFIAEDGFRRILSKCHLKGTTQQRHLPSGRYIPPEAAILLVRSGFDHTDMIHVHGSFEHLLPCLVSPKVCSFLYEGDMTTICNCTSAISTAACVPHSTGIRA
jgi:hypothetical protein